MANDNTQIGLRPGIYNTDYYTSSQTAIYIGEVLVDEVTSMQWNVSQNKRPIYGYTSQLYDQLSKGQVLVHGTFTINFKEAGYLFLILQRYRQAIFQNPHPFFSFKDEPGFNGENKSLAQGEQTIGLNIEQIINGEVSIRDRNQALSTLATAAALQGFSSSTRAAGEVGLGDKTNPRTGKREISAESLFEAFENKIWKTDQQDLDSMTRRADDNLLNPFDIYVAYGDFDGDDRRNHTIKKLSEVSIIGEAQQIQIGGLPLQEQYTFIARNLV